MRKEDLNGALCFLQEGLRDLVADHRDVNRSHISIDAVSSFDDEVEYEDAIAVYRTIYYSYRNGLEDKWDPVQEVIWEHVEFFEDNDYIDRIISLEEYGKIMRENEEG